MTATRLTSIGAILLAITLYTLSASPENQEAYLFPKIITLAMTIIAVAMLVFEWTTSKEGRDGLVGHVPWGKLSPALAIFLIYMLIAEYLGFFTSSLLAFAALGVIYTSARTYSAGFKRCLPISIVFMAALYALFVLLLHVQLPTGIFI